MGDDLDRGWVRGRDGWPDAADCADDAQKAVSREGV